MAVEEVGDAFDVLRCLATGSTRRQIRESISATNRLEFINITITTLETCRIGMHICELSVSERKTIKYRFFNFFRIRSRVIFPIIMILRKNIRKNKETYTSLYLCGAIWLSPTKLSNGQPTNIKTAIPGMIEIEEFFEEIEIFFL